MTKYPFDSDEMDRTRPRTEDSSARGFVDERDGAEPETYDDFDESDAFDDDGDIADEGFGHRG